VVPSRPRGWLLRACERLTFSSNVSSAQNPLAFAARDICSHEIDRAKDADANEMLLDSQALEQGFFSRIRWWLSGRPSEPPPLLRAARNGRLLDVMNSLRHGDPVNATDLDGRTALALALRDGYADVATVLLANGADYKIADKAGSTSLHDASASGLTGMAWRLLEAGAPVDQQDSEGVTPLMVAAWHGDLEMMKLLVDHHASVNAQDHFGRTPLIDTLQVQDADALKAERVKVVNFLLEHGADVNLKANAGVDFGTTALLLAQQNNFPDIVDRLKAEDPQVQEALPFASFRFDPRVLPAALRPYGVRLVACRNGNLDSSQQQQLFKEISSTAQQGDGDAEFLLGLANGIGCGTPTNQETARDSFRKSANQGNGLGEAAYGLSLWLGEGGHQQVHEAEKYMKRSADSKNPFGQLLLALYEWDTDKDASTDLVKQAAPYFAPAANAWGLRDGWAPNAKGEVDPYLKKASELGDPMAAKNIASGDFAARDFAASVRD